MTGGAASDWLVVVANVPDEGTALLVVHREADGVSEGELGASIDGSTHSPFTFDAVAVPESRLLGSVGDGLPRAMANIDRMRLGVAADCVGWSRWVNRTTLERIEGPHRSGSPLAEQQQVQAIFADMVAETFAARTALYQAAEAREADEPTAGTQVAAAKVASVRVPAPGPWTARSSSTEPKHCSKGIRSSGCIESAARCGSPKVQPNCSASRWRVTCAKTAQIPCRDTPCGCPQCVAFPDPSQASCMNEQGVPTRGTPTGNAGDGRNALSSLRRDLRISDGDADGLDR